MTQVAIDALLFLLVAACWLAALGLLRLRTPFERLHCVSFVNVTTAPILAIVALLADGASARSLKILILAVVTLLVGAALAHATGRALRQRGQGRSRLRVLN